MLCPRRVPIARSSTTDGLSLGYRVRGRSGETWVVNKALEAKKALLYAFCLKHSIRRLSLFGSQQGNRARPESDLDLIVEFDPEKEPGLIGLAQMERELSDMLGGQVVDLRTPNDLSRYFREEVMRSAQVQYAR